MTATNQPGFFSSGSQMFSDSQLAEIHHASLEILRRTGVRVQDSEARDLLGDAGCLVSGPGEVSGGGGRGGVVARPVQHRAVQP